jgi:hypothetical protein
MSALLPHVSGHLLYSFCEGLILGLHVLGEVVEGFNGFVPGIALAHPRRPGVVYVRRFDFLPDGEHEDGVHAEEKVSVSFGQEVLGHLPLYALRYVVKVVHSPKGTASRRQENSIAM